MIESIGNLPATATSIAAATTDSSRFEIVLFFACGIGSSLCYITALSALVYFESQYGSESYVYLNFAVYAPLVPISLAQARYDQEIDQYAGSYRTFLFRGVVGFVVSAVVTTLIPFVNGLSSIIILSALLGTAGAILQGMFNQMASFVSAGGVLKASISSGLQASALVVLLVSILTGFGSSGNASGLRSFFFIVAGIEVFLFFVFLLLMWKSRLIAMSMIQRDSSLMEFTPPLLDNYALSETTTILTLASNENGPQLQDSSSSFDLHLNIENNDDNNNENEHRDENEETGSLLQPRERTNSSISSSRSITQLQQQPIGLLDLTYKQLWNTSSLCNLTLINTLISSFLVGSWFTHVKTNFVALPQWLFYTRIGCDFLGRIATIVVAKPASVRNLFVSSIVRILPVVLFFVNANVAPSTSSSFSTNDAISLLLAASIAFSSGYQVTGCFQLAPELIPLQQRERNVSKQTSLLNVSFSFAAFAGISLSLLFSFVGS